MGRSVTDKQYGLKRMLRFYYDNNSIRENSRIQVENIKADILLLASENDDCWTAEVSAKHIAEILENVNYPHRVKNVIYEKGSHAIGSRLGNAATRKRITGMLLASKKMPEIGMATAYRMLGVLEEVGAIRREGIFQMCCHRHMEVQGFEVETDTKNVS